jgi:hypothetical protein
VCARSSRAGGTIIPHWGNAPYSGSPFHWRPNRNWTEPQVGWRDMWPGLVPEVLQIEAETDGEPSVGEAIQSAELCMGVACQDPVVGICEVDWAVR